MNFKWFFSVSVIPVFSILLGVGISYFMDINSSISGNSQCVVAIKSPKNDENFQRADMIVTSNGILVEANKAGVFVIPCNLNKVRISLHSSKTKSLLGYTYLSLSKEKMQIIDQKDLESSLNVYGW